MKQNDVVLVDTCVIIEAYRTNTWKSLHNAFKLETVETCIIEAQTGKAISIGQPVSDIALRKCFNQVHDVSSAQRAQHAIDCNEGLPDLDAGELDLWIHALQRQDRWLLCGPDRASMLFGCMLGHKDKLVSLEHALGLLNVKANSLASHYKNTWLSDVKTNFILGKS